jgi:hypothetical protein
MKKADLILKKAALFERLASYGKRSDFLKALAQESTHEIYNKNFDILKSDIDRIRGAIAKSPDKSKFTNYTPITNIDVMSVVIDDLIDFSRESNLAKSYIASLQGKYNELKNSWKLPETKEQKQQPILPSQMVNAPISKQPNAAGDTRLAKWYSVLESGNKLIDTISTASDTTDHNLLKSLYPQYKQLVVELNNFKRDFPKDTVSGESATMYNRVDQLLNEFTRYWEKMQRHYF